MEKLPLLGYAPLYLRDRGHLQLNPETTATNPKDLSFYSNGWQSWSNNYTLFSNRKWPSSPVKLGRINLENQDFRIKGHFQSEYHTVIYSLKSHTAMILGFITLKDQFSRIMMDPLEFDGDITWLCAYSQTDGIALKDLNHGCRKSEILMISLVPNPQAH